MFTCERGGKGGTERGVLQIGGILRCGWRAQRLNAIPFIKYRDATPGKSGPK